MAKFMNIVRCKVKSSSREEYLKKIDERPKFDGQISAKYVETKPNEFFMIGEWNTEEDIARARPKMIEFLDSLRNTLEELSPELGVTDPHSGSIIIEK
jgi:quinol monooxygenase YgiN